MFAKISKRLTYANVAATLALVFAMSGGAYAASKYLITSTKQIKPSVLKQLQGKAGAGGTQGIAGPQGPAGAKGEPGAVGGAGKEGAAGKNGEKGEQGIAGKNGEQGEPGSPWTAGGTLPAGQTLKGYWSGTGYGSEAYPEPGLGQVLASVSFALPLGTELTGDTTHYIKEEAATPSGCTGDVHNPGAEPGNLCVFAESEVNVGTENGAQAQFIERSKIGFTIGGGTAGKGRIVLAGSWAVTAPEAG